MKRKAFIAILLCVLPIALQATCHAQFGEGNPARFIPLHNNEPTGGGSQASLTRIPDSDKVFRTARLRLSEGKVAAAKQAFQQAISIYPHNAEAWVGLAEVAEKQGNHAEAIRAYRFVLYPTSDWGSTLSSDRGVLFGYAQVCDKVGQSAEAARAYVRVVDGATMGLDFPPLVANPQNGKELRALAWVAVGIGRQKMMDTKQSVVAYRKAVRLSPQLAVAHLYLGAALSRLHNTPGAEKEGQVELKKAASLGRGAVKQAAEKQIVKQ